MTAAFVLSRNAGVAIGIALGACISGLAIGFSMTRYSQMALAQLRNSDLRNSCRRRTGPFDALIVEVTQSLNKAEERTAEEQRSRRELEARAHVHRQTVRRLELALHNLQQGVLISDANKNIIYTNSSAQNILAACEKTSEQTSVDQAQALRHFISEASDRRNVTHRRTVEFDIPCDGRVVQFRAEAINIRTENGDHLGVVTLLTDISDTHRERTRHAEFVSSVAHELKTPMAGIKAYAELLIDGDCEDEEERQEFYRYIDGQVDRLTRMVNSMLNLARIESGIVEVNRENCELNDVLQAAFSTVQPTGDEKQIRMVCELSELYLPVHVDRDLMGQAIINLLSNAVKYTPQGGTVKLRSRMDETQAVIEVADSGMGIPTEDLPRVFDRFYRVQQNNKAASGTGLGLALVRYISEDIHGGSISVESTVGEGSRFIVRLPLGHRESGKKDRSQPRVCTTT